LALANAIFSISEAQLMKILCFSLFDSAKNRIIGYLERFETILWCKVTNYNNNEKPKLTQKQMREEALAKALRDNLRRRKAAATTKSDDKDAMK
jgi:hypothetical protein